MINKKKSFAQICFSTHKKYILRFLGEFSLLILITIGVMSFCFQSAATTYSPNILAEFETRVKEINDNVLNSDDKIDAKLPYQIYIEFFKDNSNYKNKEDVKKRLISCFSISNGTVSAAVTSTDTIFDKVEQEFSIKIQPSYRKNLILRSGVVLKNGVIDQILIKNLTQSIIPEQNIAQKTNIGLVNFAWNALDCKSGYIYGSYGQTVTLDYLLQQQNKFANDSNADLSNDEVMYIYSNYADRPSFDCIGLIKAYSWMDEKTGIITCDANHMPDVGANSIMKLDGLIWGDIANMPDVPGLAVQTDNHIGIYIGNGEVIEAKGNHFGVIKTQLSSGSWKRWLQVPSLTYIENGIYNIHGETVTISDRKIISQ